MCMKNVNVNTFFTEKEPKNECGVISFGNLLQEVKGKQLENGEIMVENLTIVTLLNAFSEEEDSELNKKFNIQWALEASSFENQSKIILAQSVYDTTKNKREKEENKTCRSFSNQICVLNMSKVELKEGRYFLKVYLKEDDDAMWQIQSISTVYVKRED